MWLICVFLYLVPLPWNTLRGGGHDRSLHFLLPIHLILAHSHPLTLPQILSFYRGPQLSAFLHPPHSLSLSQPFQVTRPSQSVTFNHHYCSTIDSFPPYFTCKPFYTHFQSSYHSFCLHYRHVNNSCIYFFAFIPSSSLTYMAVLALRQSCIAFFFYL